MADFNNMTLSAPQGAGTGAVAPVQRQVVPEQDLSPVVRTLANEFGEYGKALKKKEAEDRKTAILSEYQKEENKFVEAAATGVPAAKTSALSRANFQKFITAHPEYTEDLMKARKARYDGTETGEIQSEVDKNKARIQKEDDLLMEAGMPTYPGQSAESRKAQLDTVYTMKRVDDQFKRTTARNAELRAAAGEAREGEKHDWSVRDRKATEDAVDGINTILSSNFDSHTAFLKDMLSGGRPPEEAKFMIGQRLSQLQAQANSIASRPQDKALIEPFMKSFQSLTDVATKMLDPGAKRDELQATYDSIILQTKIGFVSDPSTRADVVGMQLFGNAPQVAAISGRNVLDSIARMSKAEINVPVYLLPPVVGNPAVEGASLDLLKEGLGNLYSGKGKLDSEGAKREATQTVTQLLRQTEDIVNRGASAKDLTKIASFYASPEFGQLAADGKLDKAAMAGAKRAFQSYNTAVVGAVEKEMGEMSDNPRRSYAPAKIQELVDLNFSNGRIAFSPVSGAQGQDVAGTQPKALATMRKSEEAITKLVIIGAHMEGTRDYQKYWEANKHHILPNLYADPSRLKPGDVVDGMVFKGGVYSAKRNWEKPASGTSK